MRTELQDDAALANLANMSMDQLSAMELEEGTGDPGELETAELDVDGADSSVGAEAEGEGEGQPDGEANGESTYVETKAGKGKIPYKVLEATRNEVAALREKLAEMEKTRGGNVAYQAALPENYQEQLAEVNSRKQALQSAFEGGEVTWEDFLVKRDELEVESNNLTKAAIKAEIALEMSQQQAEQAWEDTIKAFISTPRDGIDYSDPAMHADLDLYVKAFAADPANEDKSGEWFLQTAHAAVVIKNGGAAKATPPAPGDTTVPGTQPSATPGQQATTPATPRAPFNTLSDLPGGSPPAQSELEALGELSEAVIAKRFAEDPAAMERYLAQLGQI